MFIRYRRSENGAPEAKAYVYTAQEHMIDPRSVDPDAIGIVQRLKSNGHEAYIVGGAVRDLLLGRKPKDFDLVTDAHPARIKKLFRNARIIGKRFRLVHIYVGDRIYELSTFRSIANGTVGNEFGTMDEDAQRRDFTFNALYYDPTERLLVDYVEGFKDIKARRVKPVIPLKTIFKEDPVRMLRGVKYAALSGFSIPLGVRMAIRRDASLLGGTSPSRRTEEFFKILASGNSAVIVRALIGYRLLEYLAPAAWAMIRQDPSFSRDLDRCLVELDRRPRPGEDSVPPPAPTDAETAAGLDAKTPGAPHRGGSAEHMREEVAIYQAGERKVSILLSWYLDPFLRRLPGGLVPTKECYFDALARSRDFLSPLSPPRLELEAAVLEIFMRSDADPFARPAGPTARARSRRRGGRSRGPKADSPAGQATPDTPTSPEPGARPPDARP